MINSLLLSLAAACSLNAQEPQHLVYALPTTETAAIAFVAIDKGFFKEEGLDVEGKMFSSGREALQALLAGQAQIQSVSETPIVHAILQGNKVVTIATQARHKEAKLLARKDHGILKPEDVRGKRVATVPGTNSDFFMYEFFEKYKIPLSDVKIANMSPPEMVVALTKGDIDGYFAWEPHIYYGSKQLGDKAIVFPAGALYQGWNTVNMDSDFVRAHPDTVRKVLLALLKSEAFIKRHPKEALDLVCKRLKVDPDVARSQWKETVYRVELDKGLPALMARIGRWAIAQEKLDMPLPDFRAHIYSEALAKVRPSAVRL